MTMKPAFTVRFAAARRLASWRRAYTGIDPETEYLPAALEVLETPPSPAGRAVAQLIALFFVIALVWACFGKIDVISTAPGKIVPAGRVKIVQPFETGVIRGIHVQDGQAVKAGDVLIEIDTTISEAEEQRLAKDLLAAQLDAARLKAALSDADDPLTAFQPPENASAAQVELQKSQLVNQVQEIRAKLSGLDKQIAQNEGNRIAVEATIGKLTASIPMLQKRSAMRKDLSDRGYGSKLDSLTAEQDLVEHQNELKVEQGRLAEAMAGVAALKEQRQQAEAEYRHKNLDDLAQAEAKAASLQEQLVQATEKYKLQTLAAPVDGTVQQLAVHTEGGVVTPAQALMVIVPAGTGLEIEAMVPNREIGFVHEGQEAEIKVDTFDFTKYGFIHGKVASVSHDRRP